MKKKAKSIYEYCQRPKFKKYFEYEQKLGRGGYGYVV